MPGSSKWSVSLRFPDQNPVYTFPFPHMCYMPRPIILIDVLTHTILGEKYRSLSCSLCSFLHSPRTSSLLGPNISSTPSACVPPSMWATKFHTHTKQQFPVIVPIWTPSYLLVLLRCSYLFCCLYQHPY